MMGRTLICPYFKLYFCVRHFLRHPQELDNRTFNFCTCNPLYREAKQPHLLPIVIGLCQRPPSIVQRNFWMSAVLPIGGEPSNCRVKGTGDHDLREVKTLALVNSCKQGTGFSMDRTSVHCPICVYLAVCFAVVFPNSTVGFSHVHILTEPNEMQFLLSLQHHCSSQQAVSVNQSVTKHIKWS